MAVCVLKAARLKYLFCDDAARQPNKAIATIIGCFILRALKKTKELPMETLMFLILMRLRFKVDLIRYFFEERTGDKRVHPLKETNGSVNPLRLQIL